MRLNTGGTKEMGAGCHDGGKMRPDRQISPVCAGLSVAGRGTQSVKPHTASSKILMPKGQESSRDGNGSKWLHT